MLLHNLKSPVSQDIVPPLIMTQVPKAPWASSVLIVFGANGTFPRLRQRKRGRGTSGERRTSSREPRRKARGGPRGGLTDET